MKLKLWPVAFFVLCSAGSFLSCSSEQKEPEAIPISQAAPSTPTAIPTLPPLTPTPEGSQVGGLSGVYSLLHEKTQTPFGMSRCFELLRFYPDGMVLTVSNCNAKSLEIAWQKIGRWFHREVGGSAYVPKGTYRTQGDRVWFVTHSKSGKGQEGPPVEVSYSGQISGETLTLDTYSYFTGYERKGAVFERFEPPELEEIPSTPTVAAPESEQP